jgi:hypothetical protein
MSEKNIEHIENMLVLIALKSGISPEAIGKAIGTPTKTIRNKFPMALIKKREKE